jgi:hypothetical protein
MDKEEKKNLLKWLENLPLTWRTGNIARDFSDGGKVIKTKNSIISVEGSYNKSW